MILYLAGPDVFYPDRFERADAARRLCKQYGFDALHPLDNASSDPRKICEANLAMIRRAQIVLGNLDQFRGVEPDSGTVFELGYAHALGKKVYGYFSVSQTVLERVAEYERRPILDATDRAGNAIEDFGLPANLMLSCSLEMVEGGLEACLKQLKRRGVTTGTALAHVNADSQSEANRIGIAKGKFEVPDNIDQSDDAIAHRRKDPNAESIG